PSGGAGQDTLSTFIGFLKLLGIDSMKDLAGSGKSEAFLPNDITIPGTQTVLPAGTPVSAIPLFVDSGGRNYMADTFERVLGPALKEWTTKLANERGRGGGGPGGQGGVSGKAPEPEMQQVNCPECGQAFGVQMEDIGKKTVCPNCNEEIEVTLTPEPAGRVQAPPRPKPAPKPL
ncbi:unnamed protein product, partial [marine sediment metagenome]